MSMLDRLLGWVVAPVRDLAADVDDRDDYGADEAFATELAALPESTADLTPAAAVDGEALDIDNAFVRLIASWREEPGWLAEFRAGTDARFVDAGTATGEATSPADAVFVGTAEWALVPVKA